MEYPKKLRVSHLYITTQNTSSLLASNVPVYKFTKNKHPGITPENSNWFSVHISHRNLLSSSMAFSSIWVRWRGLDLTFCRTSFSCNHSIIKGFEASTKKIRSFLFLSVLWCRSIWTRLRLQLIKIALRFRFWLQHCM